MNVIVPVILVSAFIISQAALGAEALAVSVGGLDLPLKEYGILGIWVAWLIWDKIDRRKCDAAAAKERVENEQKAAAARAEHDKAVIEEFREIRRDGAKQIKESTDAQTTLTLEIREARAALERIQESVFSRPCQRPPDSRTRATDRERSSDTRRYVRDEFTDDER
ncbi:MAG: hypothetical protein FWG74_03705 [Planctomycetes bacterium]|nr:hypothetical protein [Planctomycetota bacterium]